MELRSYLAHRGITHAAFGDLVGASASTITRLCSRKQRPSFELAARIADATQMVVTPNDFLDPAPEPALATS